LTTLNREAERQGFPDYFDAQHFIWPSPQLDALVARDFDHRRHDLQGRLMALRWGLIREVFSDDGITARRHLMRMFARDYALIFELRLKLDGSWSAGRLNDSPDRELDAVERTFQLCPIGRKRVSTSVREATNRLDELDRLLQAAGIDDEDRELKALLEVAAHIDYRGFRARIVESGDPAALGRLLESTSDFGKDIGLLRELLRRVRVYHALIKMQVIDYWSIIRQIGELD
jgi:hypothetical protein